MMQGVIAAFNQFNGSTGEGESMASSDAYDKIKPLSKKSFDEDKSNHQTLTQVEDSSLQKNLIIHE
jgi:hypothetical protein